MFLLRLFYIILCLYAFWSLQACRKPFQFTESGSLSFSTDSVKFDTIFTTLPSPTRRLIFRNSSGHNLRIKSIELASGLSSDFELIINGDKRQSVSDFELAKGDSAYIFVSFRSGLKDAKALDRILFKTQEHTQSVVLAAYIRDAYFLTDTFIACDTVFTSEKAIVVDGPLFVPAGCTLTMLPGTHIYFTSRKGPDFNPASYLIVSGTLKIQGTHEQPVILEGNRLEANYTEKGGQWFGVYLSRYAQACEIRHALIKNAVFGIRTDSISVTQEPKLKLIQTEIRNMEYYGIWMVGFANPVQQIPVILAENILVTNCAKQALRVNGGGIAHFHHATMASYNFDFNRKEPLVFLNNYGENFAYPLHINFLNCVIHGQEKSEIKFDDAGITGAYNVWFENCLLQHENIVNGENNIFSVSPGFEDAKGRNFRPVSGSPLIDKGKGIFIFVDIENKSRPKGNGFDIGCYEFEP